MTIVIPCFNEEDVLPETSNRLSHILDDLVKAKKISTKSQIVYVDDGSRDSTWNLIEKMSQTLPYVSGIKLSRNRGHQNAVCAGMMTVGGDAVITIDADLQDDLNVIEKMIDEYHAGIDIVYGVRSDRSSDSFFKRTTAQSFYKLLTMFGVDIVYNHADFRLMSRRALEALREYREVNLYLRGIIPLIGFRSSIVEYSRLERFAGQSKYPFIKMLKLAIEGITSFSVVPLQIISMLGFIVSFISFSLIVWIFGIKYFAGTAIPGWASTVLPIYFLGGVQILCLGVIGSYLGKIYTEVKSRPRYFVDKVVGSASKGFDIQ